MRPVWWNEYVHHGRLATTTPAAVHRPSRKVVATPRLRRDGNASSAAGASNKPASARANIASPTSTPKTKNGRTPASGRIKRGKYETAASVSASASEVSGPFVAFEIAYGETAQRSMTTPTTSDRPVAASRRRARYQRATVSASAPTTTATRTGLRGS